MHIYAFSPENIHVSLVASNSPTEVLGMPGEATCGEQTDMLYSTTWAGEPVSSFDKARVFIGMYSGPWEA